MVRPTFAKSTSERKCNWASISQMFDDIFILTIEMMKAVSSSRHSLLRESAKLKQVIDAPALMAFGTSKSSRRNRLADGWEDLIKLYLFTSDIIIV